MDDFRVCVVIPVGGGRAANVRRVLAYLDTQTEYPEGIILILDGIEPFDLGEHEIPIVEIQIPKHHPGMEQPRNVGVRAMEEHFPQCNWAWFLDSDIAVGQDCLGQFRLAFEVGDREERILLGPYEWLQPGQQGVITALRNDPRWADFHRYGPETTLRYHLGAALANFSGNLCWPVAEFKRVGGFHPELFMGRCEDGELGMRASSLGVGVSFVKAARGYHQWHPVDMEETHRKNSIDVPKLWAWHPWARPKEEGGEGLILSSEDGARFDFKCSCGAQVNTWDYWAHRAACPAKVQVR